MSITNILDLPEEIVRLIYAFCIDKRVNWDKVGMQFLKGGFNRKNMCCFRFIQRQKEMCKQFWLSNRPELSGLAQWNSATRRTEICPFGYRYGEWSIKTKSVVVCFTTGTGYRNKISGKNPVSKWLGNINKFEAAAVNYWWPDGFQKKWRQHPLNYLPKEKNRFGIKFESAFYKKRAHMLEKKRKKRADLDKANLFIEERRKLKKMCGFEQGQQVILSFHMPVPILGATLKFYRGSVVQIFLKQHRDNGRLIFAKPKGRYEFDNDAVDNYIGETWIKIRFEDGEKRLYTPENLVDRIIQSNKVLDVLDNKYFVRGWYTSSGCWKSPRRLEKVTIKGVQYYIKKKDLADGENTMLILEKKRLTAVGEIRKLEGEYLLTIYQNRDFGWELEVLKSRDGYLLTRE